MVHNKGALQLLVGIHVEFTTDRTADFEQFFGLVFSTRGLLAGLNVAIYGAVAGLLIGMFRPKRFKLTIDDEYLTFGGKSYALADINRIQVHRHKGGAFCYVWAEYGRKEMNLKVWRFFHDASKLQELLSSEIEKRAKGDVAINNDDLEIQHRAAAF